MKKIIFDEFTDTWLFGFTSGLIVMGGIWFLTAWMLPSFRKAFQDLWFLSH